MSDDMFEWEKDAFKLPIVTILSIVKKEFRGAEFTKSIAFVCKDKELILPERLLGKDEGVAENASKLARQLIDIEPTWLRIHFVGFFDQRELDIERVIRFVYQTSIPENVSVNSKMEWVNYYDLARAGDRISRETKRICRAAANCD
jgi:hypothetical protein